MSDPRIERAGHCDIVLRPPSTRHRKAFMNDLQAARLQQQRRQAASSFAAQAYWEKRKHLVYYNVIRILVGKLSQDASSLLDVGSGNCPYLEWFDHVDERISLDAVRPYSAPGITSVKQDFLQWSPQDKVDVATCLQVMEHVPAVEEFARKLLDVANVLVISVPYKWPAGRTPGHVHDPVDEAKLHQWFGRKPNYSYMCREITGEVYRLVQVYDQTGKPWRSLKDRERLLSR